MSIRPLLALLLCACTLPVLAQDGDPAAGKAKSVTCAACHGPDGNSTNPEWPKIAGQHARYVTKQLMAFKEGTSRNNAMMTGMVAALSGMLFHIQLERFADGASERVADRLEMFQD